MAYEAVDAIEMERRREAVRGAVVASAGDIVRARGFPALRAKDLAASAGCSVGVLYAAFGDMDGVALALKASVLGKMAAALTAASLLVEDGADHAVDRIKAIGSAYVDFALADPEMWSVLFQQRIGGCAVPAGLSEGMRDFVSILDDSLGQIVPEASRARKASLGRAVMATLAGVVSSGLDHRDLPGAGDEIRWRVSAMLDALVVGLTWEGQRIAA